MNYEQKYLKYKKKYIDLKAQTGGVHIGINNDDDNIVIKINDNITNNSTNNPIITPIIITPNIATQIVTLLNNNKSIQNTEALKILANPKKDKLINNITNFLLFFKLDDSGSTSLATAFNDPSITKYNVISKISNNALAINHFK